MRIYQNGKITELGRITDQFKDHQVKGVLLNKQRKMGLS
jgi:hypothetical protein